MVKALVLSTDEAKRKRLLLVIQNKKKTLLQLSAAYETLKNDLDLIQREYYMRVGSLLNRDNELDLEIIKLKNLLACMKLGMTYREAVESLKDAYYSESDYAETFTDESFVAADFKEETDNKKELLRALWKKIVTKFHPDLTVDPEEKKRREAIMKQVNKAYADGNQVLLEELYKTNHIATSTELSVKDLEQMIVQIENSIIKVKKETFDLKKTEWYGWKTKMKKAKKVGTDIFRDLEHALLDDIVKKINLLNTLKNDVNTIRSS